MHVLVRVTLRSLPVECVTSVRVSAPRHDVTPSHTKTFPSHKWKRSNYSASHSSLTGWLKHSQAGYRCALAYAQLLANSRMSRRARTDPVCACRQIKPST